MFNEKYQQELNVVGEVNVSGIMHYVIDNPSCTYIGGKLVRFYLLPVREFIKPEGEEWLEKVENGNEEAESEAPESDSNESEPERGSASENEESPPTE